MPISTSISPMAMFSATRESISSRGSGRIISATIATMSRASSTSLERDIQPPDRSLSSLRYDWRFTSALHRCPLGTR